MVDSDFITFDEARKALAKPLQIAKPKRWALKEMDYFTEEVRRQAEARFGRDMLYKEGLIIQTTLDLKAQRIAEKALDQGLRELDKRHKQYRGLHVNVPRDDWPSALRVLGQSNGELEEGKVVAGLVESIRRQIKDNFRGPWHAKGVDSPSRVGNGCRFPISARRRFSAPATSSG